MTRTRLDADEVKRSVRLTELIGRDVRLERQGKSEARGLCPFHNERTPSFDVVEKGPDDQFYYCHGCGAHGDAIDYVIETRKVPFREALRQLSGSADDPGLRREQDAPERADPYAGIEPIVPAPDTAPAIAAGRQVRAWNPKRERVTTYQPAAAYPYRQTDGGLVGYVIRQEIDAGRKITPALMFCRLPDGKTAWTHYAFPEPRPLYGADQMGAGQVIVVEGEKTADAGTRLIGRPCVTWAGGTKAVERTDWTPLQGRKVVIVPDCDGPGRAAADQVAARAHAADAAEIKVVDVPDADGWDLADAEAEGWTKADTVAWMRKHARVWTPPDPDPEPAGPKAAERRQKQADAPAQTGHPDPAPDDTPPDWHASVPDPVDTADAPPAANDDWRAALVYNEDGTLKKRSQKNAAMLLRHHEDLRGVFVYDAFARTIQVYRCPPWEDQDTFEVHRLHDSDVTRAAVHMETIESTGDGVTIKPAELHGLIASEAERQSVHPARDYFRSLRWDGRRRLDTWLTYYLGADNTVYTQAVGRKWLIGAVRRVFSPGCKFDNMLILEGPQGLKKSTALRTLATFNGVPYFTDSVRDIGSKDAAMLMQGVLIVEIAELDAMSKAEVTAVKSWITQQVDQYRPPYGRSVVYAERQCVLAGTVNPEGGYLKDATGNRRFWPVHVTSIDLEALEEDREQLWAEAVEAVNAGEPAYLTGEAAEAAKDAQAQRYDEDPWAEDIDEFLVGKMEITTRDIMKHALEIPKERRNRAVEMRVARHLGTRGWHKARVRRNGALVNVFQRPD